jgi:hypothetical protein
MCTGCAKGHQLGHRDASITLRVYAHWLPSALSLHAVDRLDDATFRNPDATEALRAIAASGVKPFVMNGEPPRNRTENPQIKSLLLCQLS